jgi:hypothetical protein
MLSFHKNIIDPLTSLNIGKRFTGFGFTSKMLDKSFNDGKHIMFISEKFGEQIMYNLNIGKMCWYLADGFGSRFKHRGGNSGYACSFRFIKIDINGVKMFYTIGLCGDYGFHSTLYSKKYTLSPYVVKQCLDQLYDHLEKEFNRLNKV